MTPTQVTTKEELNKLDEPIRASNWRNLWFTKCGKRFNGDGIHPSEEVARNKAKKQIEMAEWKAANHPSGICILLDENDKDTGLFWHDISYVLQIPIVEKE